MTQICDIRQLYVVELDVSSQQKLSIVIERVRRVLPQQNTTSVKYSRVISYGNSHVACES